jgi:hypothetical protein
MVLLAVIYAKTIITPSKTQGKKEAQESTGTTESSGVIHQQKLSDNNIKTTVSEKINNKEIPVVQIISKEPLSNISTVPRKYNLSIQETEGTLQPILSISTDTPDDTVIIKGDVIQKSNLRNIIQKRNGIIFKPFVLTGMNVSQDIKYNWSIGGGFDWLKYKELMFLSVSAGIDYNIKDNKEIHGSLILEPVKYNFYSNTSISGSIGINNKLTPEYGINVSIQL